MMVRNTYKETETHLLITLSTLLEFGLVLTQLLVLYVQITLRNIRIGNQEIIVIMVGLHLLTMPVLLLVIHLQVSRLVVQPFYLQQHQIAEQSHGLHQIVL